MARTLVVDDEETYRRLLTSILERSGHQVRTAATGPEAIEAGAALGPQLLIVDWALAGELDGLRVAEALRKDNSDLRVILITGYSTDDVPGLATMPLTQVLEKPFGIGQLLAAMGKVLADSPQST